VKVTGTFRLISVLVFFCACVNKCSGTTLFEFITSKFKLLFNMTMVYISIPLILLNYESYWSIVSHVLSGHRKPLSCRIRSVVIHNRSICMHTQFNVGNVGCDDNFTCSGSIDERLYITVAKSILMAV
jgi:hypothetical protein